MTLVEAVSSSTAAPNLYVLNANSLVKRNSVAHLARDLFHYRTDVAVISETHLNERHTQQNFAIRGYDLLRRDRTGRPGGGVAIYANQQVPLDVIVVVIVVV